MITELRLLLTNIFEQYHALDRYQKRVVDSLLGSDPAFGDLSRDKVGAQCELRAKT